MLLDASPAAAPAAVHDGLRTIDNMLHELASGRVRELDGQPDDHASASAEQFAGLEHFFAFGRRLFDVEAHQPPLVGKVRPDYLAYLPADGPFPKLRWVDGVRNRGEADVAIQLTGDRQAAVNCAAVEVWKLLEDLKAPVRPVASFAGFGRHDGRGWLEFHDGVSNIETSHRLAALEAPADPEWMAGGTYMAFLRLAIDLFAWRTLSRAQQELIVGRDKLTGAAVLATERGASGNAVSVAAPPPNRRSNDRERSDYIDPPQSTEALIEASHVHRANQNRGSPSAAAALRMFRQGYDFLDDIDLDGPRLGLNFVSFQRSLAVFHHVLHLPGWLGDVNFGGPVDPQRGDPPQTPLISVLAGGLYAVPPVSEPFPGAEIFKH